MYTRHLLAEITNRNPDEFFFLGACFSNQQKPQKETNISGIVGVINESTKMTDVC